MCREVIEPEAEVVDSESIRSGKVPVQSTHLGPQLRPQGTSTLLGRIRLERGREQLGSTWASSICHLASAPLPGAQWLSGKSVRLVFGRSWVRFPVGSQIFSVDFLSLS